MQSAADNKFFPLFPVRGNPESVPASFRIRRDLRPGPDDAGTAGRRATIGLD